MAITHVIFDLGGVLVEWDPIKIVENHTENKSYQNEILEQIIYHPDWLELDRGSFTEEEAIQRITNRSNLSTSEIKLVFQSIRDNFTVIANTEKILRSRP